jgi:hypothetical protein
LRTGSGSRRKVQLTADDLASLTGYPESTLVWALPELRGEQEPKQPTKWENDRARRLRKATDYACSRCAAAKGIFEKVSDSVPDPTGPWRQGPLPGLAPGENPS